MPSARAAQAVGHQQSSKSCVLPCRGGDALATCQSPDACPTVHPLTPFHVRRAIDLSRNHLHASFIPTIIPILPLNSVLSYLNLSHNGLGDASVCILLRTIAGIWRDDPVRLKIRRLGIAGTRMGRRATFALAAMLSSIRSSLLEYDPALPPAFTADWSFEVDISDHDLVGVAPVVLARQILRLSDIQGRQPDGGARVRVVADRVSTTCLARQGLLEGEVLYEAEELKGLIGDTDKGKKGGKGKGKGKKGKKVRRRVVEGDRDHVLVAGSQGGRDTSHREVSLTAIAEELPGRALCRVGMTATARSALIPRHLGPCTQGEKPRIVKVGERFNLECADEEHKDMLVLLVEHELLATAKDPPEKLFYTLRLGTRTYRLAGHDFPVGGKKSTFDIRDIKVRHGKGDE